MYVNKIKLIIIILLEIAKLHGENIKSSCVKFSIHKTDVLQRALY